MPNPITIPFTSEVYARKRLGKGYNTQLILWAEQMVLSGFESDQLNALLGETAPFNAFEMDDYLNRIQNQLNIPSIDTESEAVDIIATSIIRKHHKCCHTTDPPLEELMSLYQYDDETHNVYDFYLLHFAVEDLKVNEHQYYWPEANQRNITSIVSERFMVWMAAYPLNKWRAFEWSDNPKPSE